MATKRKKAPVALSRSGKGVAFGLDHKAEREGIKALLKKLPKNPPAAQRQWVDGMRKHYQRRLKELQ